MCILILSLSLYLQYYSTKVWQMCVLVLSLSVYLQYNNTKVWDVCVFILSLSLYLQYISTKVWYMSVFILLCLNISNITLHKFEISQVTFQHWAIVGPILQHCFFIDTLMNIIVKTFCQYWAPIMSNYNVGTIIGQWC